MSSLSNKPNEKLGYRPNASTKEKTYIRVIAEVLKKLVNSYQTRSCEDIFLNDDIKFMRFKLKENLKKLMFLEPLEFGQKAEDTIWKSIFYEPIRLFKRHLKTNPSLVIHNSTLYIAYRHHIKESIGYYHKLIITLMTNYGLMNDIYQEYFMQFSEIEDDENNEKIVSKEIKEWAMKCTQRSLLFMGDLYRYEVEIEENKKNKNDIVLNLSRDLPCGYYNMVLKMCSYSGHAYNQLGTLEMSKNYGLNAAFYFLQAQFSRESFSASKDNLIILYERNIKKLRTVIDKETMYNRFNGRRDMKKANMKIFRVKSAIVKYLNIWHCFTNYKIKVDEMDRLSQMCDDILRIFSLVLSYDRKFVSKHELTQRKSDESAFSKKPTFLTIDMLDKLLFVGFASLYTLRCKQMKETTEKENSLDLSEEDKVHDYDEDDRNSDAPDLYSSDVGPELAQCFLLNMCGQMLNQTLVRLRDEIKLRNLSPELVFRRHDQATRILLDSVKEGDHTSEEDDDQAEIEQEIQEEKSKPEVDADLTETKQRNHRTRPRLGLNKRLQRRLITKSQHDNEYEDSVHEFDESEDDFDDDDEFYCSDSAEDDQDDEVHVGGILYSEDEDDFEEDEEEIHSQDEDDRIIRAIVGQDALFGRQVSMEKEGNKELNSETGNKIDSLLYNEPVSHHLSKKPGLKKDRSKQSSSQFDSQDNSKSTLNTNTDKLSVLKPSGTAQFPPGLSTDNVVMQLAKSLDSVDILHTVTGIVYQLFRYLLRIRSDTIHTNQSEYLCEDAQSRAFLTPYPAPYLWKHLMVLMNFAESLLDDLDLYQEPIDVSESLKICDHIKLGHIRHTSKLHPNSTLPEDKIFQGTLWGTQNTIQSDHTSCSNWLHVLVCRLIRILELGDWLLSSKVSKNLPIKKKSVLLPDSYQDYNLGMAAAGKKNIWIIDTAVVKGMGRNRFDLVYCFLQNIVNGYDYDEYYEDDENYDDNTEDKWEEIKSAKQNTNNQAKQSPDNVKSSGVPKEELIQKLAQLRLKNELEQQQNSPQTIKKFEQQTSTDEYENQSLYIIPDLNYLCKKLDRIRAILKTQKHILVIPAGLLARMDQLKKQQTSFDIRNTAKFLEEQFSNKQSFVKLDNASQPGTVNKKMSNQIDEHISDWSILEGSAKKMLETKSDRCDESFSSDSDLLTTTILTDGANSIPKEVKDFYSSNQILFRSHIEI